MDLKAHLEILEPIVRHAGEILKDHFQREREYQLKSNIDLVTEADKACEAYLLQALQEAFPNYGIIGEEGSEFHPEKGGAPDYFWYVDPLDGTTNFAHRYAHFSISIALAGIDRHPVLGVIYDPMRDEYFTAYQNGGAFLNGTPIQVSKIEQLDQALLATGFPYDSHTSPDNNAKELAAMLRRAQGIRRAGSAALDLAYVAAGRFDGFWEMKLHLWDCLAGIILVQEAGGKVTDYHNSERQLYEKRPQCIASNSLIHETISIVLVTAR